MADKQAMIASIAKREAMLVELKDQTDAFHAAVVAAFTAMKSFCAATPLETRAVSATLDQVAKEEPVVDYTAAFSVQHPPCSLRVTPFVRDLDDFRAECGLVVLSNNERLNGELVFDGGQFVRDGKPADFEALIADTFTLP
jgi:hypothetical protein